MQLISTGTLGDERTVLCKESALAFSCLEDCKYCMESRAVMGCCCCFLKAREARDAAWSDWNANQASDWEKETANVFSSSPENVYGFEPTWGYRTSGFDLENSETETFEPNFSFCSFNEGHDQSSLDAMKSKYNAWLEEANDDNSEPYAYVMLEPQQSTEGVDFVWLDLFLSMEDKQSGEESWAGTDLEKDWNEMAQCQTYQFAATAIRR